MKWRISERQVEIFGIGGEKRMASGRLVKSVNLVCSIVAFFMVSTARGDAVTFDDLSLPVESYWNGSDGSGGFISGGIHFSNNYDSTWDSWDGFSYSNITDTTMTGTAGQYNAITGAGQGNSANYVAGYAGWAAPPTVTMKTTSVVEGLYVTNNNSAYYAMLKGDAFAKKFGGESGNDPDWLMLTITGKNADGITTGTVEFYLADYRFADNDADYLVDTWEYVDLTSLGIVKSIEFSLSSSDAGDWGMNTPAYFAIDTLIYRPVSVYNEPYTEAGINGYINTGNRRHHASPEEPNAVINPIFRGWAAEVVSYNQAPGVDPMWSEPNKVLGPVTGRADDDIFSLGDLSKEQIEQGVRPGEITLFFDEPIRNGGGYDFAVFENGMLSEFTTAAGSAAGQMFAELAYVEVSSNGEDFVRFPAVSLTAQATGLFGTIEISKVYNLAGKHPNSYNICTGTPFDLEEITDEAEVVSGIVDINDIRYVRIVDIPGSGDFYDEAVMNINPNTRPDWDCYANNHPIYDAWNTSLVPLYPSGGFDLEAIGVLKEQEYSADIDLNGVVDMFDFVLVASAWHSHFGQPCWIARCDLAEPRDFVIDMLDLIVFAGQWLETEQWRE